MWNRTARFLLQYRISLLMLVALITVFMGYRASKVEMSYDFSRAIPTNNEKFKAYQLFKRKFGEDGNLVVIGIQKENIFELRFFNDYALLQKNIKKIYGVEDIISVTSAVNLVKNEVDEKLLAQPIFPDRLLSQIESDSLQEIFYNLPFYRGIIYNPETNAWLMGVRISKDVLNTKNRNHAVDQVTNLVSEFEKKHQVKMHQSGLPLIRTVLTTRIANEMKWFLAGSILLSALILMMFFRSFSAVILSLIVVIIGVIWSLGTMQLFGFKITILTALIPPLIVVIGIPNCIYFFNKYHTAYKENKHKGNQPQDASKRDALITMVSKMGIVTLFCNLAAAIGFAVFALTKSEILKEFGAVAGINIMALFFISLILIPATLSFLPAPKIRHTRYLENLRMLRWLDRLERWALNHRKLIYFTTAIIVVISIFGILRLQSVGYIVDDLPKTDKIYTDLKFFESNFKGVMPLEIVIDSKRKNGLRRNQLEVFQNMDSLSMFISSFPEMAKPLSIIEGLKFAKQGFYEGDSTSFSMPSSHDLPALSQYLNFRNDSNQPKNNFARLITSFMDDERREARISVNMADVGSERLPSILDSIQQKAATLFDKDEYHVILTGTSVTFLEGSQYIIDGLKESIFWAFLLISLCMLLLFRSIKILICSLIPNLVPLIITAGVMGWMGIALKPSTVLIFSVALGIAIDVTIRFLVNYKQELPQHRGDVGKTVIKTIHSTGISIIYTSMVLIAGFIIFCFSGFGGTQSLGWLTSLTLITATLTNLVLLPALLISTRSNKIKQNLA
jgi:predicted RND superfamily exporter protein